MDGIYLMAWTDDLKWGDDGLVAGIAQDADTGEVLMIAWMNREAVAKTIETGLAHYWSRSRGKLWLKGESSGHEQHIESIHVDCDQDALLLKVRQKGGACHEGYRTCFFRRVTETGALEVTQDRVFDPDQVYG